MCECVGTVGVADFSGVLDRAGAVFFPSWGAEDSGFESLHGFDRFYSSMTIDDGDDDSPNESLHIPVAGDDALGAHDEINSGNESKRRLCDHEVGDVPNHWLHLWAELSEAFVYLCLCANRAGEDDIECPIEIGFSGDCFWRAQG